MATTLTNSLINQLFIVRAFKILTTDETVFMIQFFVVFGKETVLQTSGAKNVET